MFAILFFIAIASADLPCGLPPKPVATESLDAWKNFAFTSPRNFDSRKFAFMVSAMSMDKADLMKEGDKVVLKRPVLYTSLINQDHRMTFSTSGVILAPPNTETIVHAIPYDTATVPCKQFDCENAPQAELLATLQSFREKYGVFPPQVVLDVAKKTWSEIVLSTVGKKEKLEVSGIFLIVDEKGKALDWRGGEEAKAQAAAKKFSLPVVRIRRKDVRFGILWEGMSEVCPTIAPPQEPAITGTAK